MINQPEHLLRGLVQVTQGQDSRLSRDSEPTEYRWVFTREDDALQVRILSFYDRMRPEPDEAGRELFAVRSEVRPLVDAVARSVRLLLSRMGEAAYARQWGGEAFPLHEQCTLESWIRNH